MNQANIRNFVIISHVDHGKSTLADRLIELTGTLPKDKIIPQMLDRHPIERERGITIKMQPIRLVWKPNQTEILKTNFENSLRFRDSNFEISNSEYILNLIDTPGHIDFSYEVSRALACVEGAILLVDATTGIQAQTLTNYYLACDQGLKIIPVINKIDLPHADVDLVADELRSLITDLGQPLLISAKTGQGVGDLLNEIVKIIPPPTGSKDAPLRALIFDSIFDWHRGVIAYVTVVDGELSPRDSILLMGTSQLTQALEIGFFGPELTPVTRLSAGEVGYIVTNTKYIRYVQVGDTITRIKDQRLKIKNNEKELDNIKPIAVFKPPNPMVWASIYPNSPADTPLLRQALEKLQLNDAALQFEPEFSPALGAGFRIGVLGLLHLDIAIERLGRDFNQSVIVAKPSVVYQLTYRDGQVRQIHSVSELPDHLQSIGIEEPWIQTTIVTPLPYLGPVYDLVLGHRGVIVETNYSSSDRPVIQADLPLSEMMVDFYDRLKTFSSGYATLSYQPIGWRPADLIRLDIAIAGEPIEPLAQLIHRANIEKVGRSMVEKIKTRLPRQQFEVKIQALVGGKVIAAERLSPLRKDVTAKLYGGDVTRKRKLLAKQKLGKKKLRRFGNIDLPSEFFHEVMQRR